MEKHGLTILIFDTKMGKSKFSNANPGAWKLFWSLETIFMAKVGPNAVDFAIA